MSRTNFATFSWRLLTVIALLALSVSAQATVIIDTVPVGNPGNADDPSDGATAAGVQHYGAVAYSYRIGTYEVTNDQYAEFLNAKAKSDPLALYYPLMGSNARGGITQSGVSGSYTYATKPNMGNKPVNYVSWYDAARFANWLHNGQGTGSTETGAYTILGNSETPSNALTITRNPGATWFLPSENEWYKAAYYQPFSQGGDTDDYWLFQTRSNSNPTTATADSVGAISNPGANVINSNMTADWNSQNGNVTTVGSAGPLSTSFYGTYDQGGNVSEFNEAIYGSAHGIRGGDFADINFLFTKSSGGSSGAITASTLLGFRVATVPEPSTFALAAIAGGLLLAVRRQFAA